MFDGAVFREKLRKARLAAGMSQKELAAQLHISTQAVSKWERGESVPDIAHVCRLAELLGLSVDRLLGVDTDAEQALIAVDGGGTKTEFALTSTTGKLLKRLILPGSNPNTCSVQGSCDILRRGIDALLQEGYRVLAVYIGGAGMASGNNAGAAEEILRKAYPHLPLQCQSDITNVLACAQTPEDAIAVICGTGSVVYATRKGKLQRFGGGGWKLETLGSGYDMGRAALLAALEHRDGTGPQTTLTAAVELKLGGKVWDRISGLYDRSPAFFADFAPLVLQAWQTGDPVAEQIVSRNSARIAHLVSRAAAFSPQATQVLLGGSLLTKSDPFRQQVIAQLPRSLRAEVLPWPQIWGACLRSAALANVPVPDVNEFIKLYTQED